MVATPESYPFGPLEGRAPQYMSLKSLIQNCEEVLVSVGETKDGNWLVIVEGVESKETTVCKAGTKREAWTAANAIRGLLMNKEPDNWVSKGES